MFVINRKGERVPVQFDAITERIAALCDGLSTLVDPAAVTKQVITGLVDGVTTSKLDELAAQTAANMVTLHPDYGKLAARIAVSDLHKRTYNRFSTTVEVLYTCTSPVTNERANLVSEAFYNTVMANAAKLDAAIVTERDFHFDYFGYRTLERSYLLKVNGDIVERPQYLFLRVALGIHGDDVDAAIETYHLMSDKWFIHATPTLFNAGTPQPQLASCFLLSMQDDSITGIFETLKQCAEISKSAGGIGLSVHNVRAKGSYIKGTNGTSNGLLPMLQVFNNTARYVDQGGGKRKGAFAMYLEPWHADIFDFLELKKNHGKEEARARDLFYALWVPDLFMKRVEEDAMWSLFDPNEAPGLFDLWGEAFERQYELYERQGLARKQVEARKVWRHILEAQIETGTPYLLYKDHANSKSNQQNLGTIRSSNLCAEIIEYTSPDEVAVCNLASINLSRFIRNGSYDFEKLAQVTAVVTRNLNKVIDVNHYPVPQAKRSNLRHRPVGIGVQALADTYMRLRLPFESDEARVLNFNIFETIYYAAIKTSMELAKQYGPYETFEGSPLSKGEFQFDLWGVQPTERYDWEALRQDVMTHGVRNSLLVALMPTATTANIMGNCEAIEPLQSNVFSRRVLSGEFVVVNKYLMQDLIERNLWSEELRQKLIASNGSVQHLDEVPADLKALYKTVWEISQKALIDQAADRGAFVCQSQSLNLFVAEPNQRKLTSMHFYAWKRGLKTGVYYLRSQAASNAVQMTVVVSTKQAVKTAAQGTATTGGADVHQPKATQPGLWQQQPQQPTAPPQSGPPTCSLDDPDCEACSA